MEKIHEDMASTVMPTYLGRPPPNIGSKGAGSLSADEWRTFCTVNLPISLIRLWGTGEIEPSDRRPSILRNFLHLVAAVRHCTATRMSQSRIIAFDRAILSYLKGLRTLFPMQNLVPNHHIALHIPEVLERFGPPHSYWAFPFERYIRLLRNANTNSRPGKGILDLCAKALTPPQMRWSRHSLALFAWRIILGVSYTPNLSHPLYACSHPCWMPLSVAIHGAQH